MKKLVIPFLAASMVVGIANADVIVKHVTVGGVKAVVYYPSTSITPGAGDPTVEQSSIKKTICVTGYTKDKRKHQTAAVKKSIFKLYDISWSKRADYEDDHFLALTDGGCDCCDKNGKPSDTDCTGNRWPQSYCAEGTGGKTCFGAREKDVVEKYLNTQVCHGRMTLEQAQHILKTDWFGQYAKLKGLTIAK